MQTAQRSHKANLATWELVSLAGVIQDGATPFIREALNKPMNCNSFSALMPTIENNRTRCSLQALDSWNRWYGETRRNFIFNVKSARYFTPLLRFVTTERAVALPISAQAWTVFVSIPAIISLR